MKWLQANGSYIDIRQMETSHLYFTMRLIWNNQYGKNYRWDRGPIRPFRDSRYTEGYLRDINFQMHQELLGRSDLTAHQKRQLEELKVLKLELLLDCPFNS